jgi:lysophospholipase L1-like esterase
MGRMQRNILLAVLASFEAILAIGQDAGWVGTWAVAPMRGEPDVRLSGVTLRQIVHTSVGGDKLRIQVSNIYGDRPLEIADMHVALRRQGASIVPATDRKVYFDGQPSIVIQPGKLAYSDPVTFEIPALADLAVSLYVVEQSASLTFHSSAHRANYIADGDVSGRIDLPDATASGRNYFLTEVEVRGKDIAGAVVALGASITEGYSASDDTANRWPDVLAQRLSRAGKHIGVLNAGISGNRLLVDGAGPDAEERFERDVLEQRGVRWVIFSDDPINDLGSTRPAPDAKTLIAATQRLIAKAHAKHILFFCSTLTPYEGANYWRAVDEIAREQFNAFVRSKHSGCDGVIDQDAAVHNPEHPNWFLPSYDIGDHLHPNDGGHRAIADAIDLSLFSPGRIKSVGGRYTTTLSVLKNHSTYR